MRKKNEFCQIAPEDIKDNPFEAIGSDWMLITAGNLSGYNMMTASWGAWGILWHKPVCFCFLRPHRYTYEFMEKADYFTLSYFDKKYKKALNICGAKSGRDIDKAAVCGLTPLEGDNGSVYFQEARMVLILKKIYFQDINPENFLEAQINDNYPKKDYHRMYAGEVIKCLLKK